MILKNKFLVDLNRRKGLYKASLERETKDVEVSDKGVIEVKKQFYYKQKPYIIHSFLKRQGEIIGTNLQQYY